MEFSWRTLSVAFLVAVPAVAAPQPAPLDLTVPFVPTFLPAESLPFSKSQLASLSRLSIESTHWEDIRGWRALGSRWAAGLDGAGRVLAIFDLSLPEGTSPYSGRIGVLGGPNFNFKAVSQLLAFAASQGDASARKRAARALSDLNKAHPNLSEQLLTEDWYKNVPWKPQARAALLQAPGQAPARFTLADIDLDSLVISRPLFHACLKYLRRFGIDLTRLELSRNQDASYSLALLPLAATAPAAAAGVPRPYLLADLRAVRSGFYETINWMIASSAIGFAIGLIPNPIVAALVGTSLDLYVHFRNEVIDLHREAAREMVAAAANGETPYSAFSSLTPAELRDAGIWLYLAQTSFFTVWNWVFKGAEGAWRSDLKSDLERARDARAWVTAQGARVRDLNPRFALNLTDRKLYLLSHFRWLGPHHEPVPGIDYDHIENALILRTVVQTASTSIDFASHFIPFVGGAVSTVWDWLITAPVHNTKDFEARLTAHLEQRELVSAENWEYELAVLDHQRLNPLERSRAESRALVVAVSRSLGIIRPSSPPAPQNPRVDEQPQSYSNALE